MFPHPKSAKNDQPSIFQKLFLTFDLGKYVFDTQLYSVNKYQWKIFIWLIWPGSPRWSSRRGRWTGRRPRTSGQTGRGTTSCQPAPPPACPSHLDITKLISDCNRMCRVVRLYKYHLSKGGIVGWINYIEHLQNLHLVPYLVRRG